ncbi:hypothetical protein WJX74_004500 [Apatococcus lobatus]|uniref:VDE lipocalin domain-containing protein n=1 Tax=Apatococcus lobatus TaxID=904363 RepID=A0AAW1R140_9CHLO
MDAANVRIQSGKRVLPYVGRFVGPFYVPFTLFFATQQHRRPAASMQGTGGQWQQLMAVLREKTVAPLFAAAVGVALLAGPAIAADPGKVGLCLFGNCQRQLASCLTDGECLEDLVCLNLCNNKKDETACQIRCGDLYSDKAVATFNSCAVSDKKCVPQRVDESLYPVPKDEVLVKSFPLNEFEGRWYITAGQNPLFDTFPCQVHYFGNPEPGKLVAKLNWRIPKSDNDFIQRDAVQYFKQQAQPGLLLNHDNDFLHYQDDWYIVAYKPNEYAFVYYKGNNDAWKGYGGAVVYTREAALPEKYVPVLREAAAKVGMDWDKDITVTDNTCGPHPIKAEGLIARVEKFASDEARALEYTIETDLRSFGKGATVLEKDFVQVLQNDEKFVGDEFKGAVSYIEDIESRYKEPTWLQKLAQTLHLPFASQAIPKQ